MRRILTLALVALAATAGALAATTADDPVREEIMQRVAALEANAAGLSEAERLETLIDLYFEYTLHTSPEFATYLGYPTGHDRWSDASLEALAQGEQDLLAGLAVVRAIDRSKLTGVDRLNYDLILEQLEDQAAGIPFKGEYMPINQLGGMHQGVPQMLAMMPGNRVEDYENILARLRGVPELVKQNLRRLEEGAKRGVTPPRITLREVPQQVANLIVEDPLTSPMLGAFTRFPESIPAAEQERLRNEAVRVYRGSVVPALQTLHDYLAGTYLPAARESIAMRELPDGEAWYAYRVRQMTTTEMTPREIHDLGLAEVKRIRAEMDRVIADSGFEGGFEEFTTFLRNDPRFYFETPEELLAAYRDIAKRADPELVKLFGRLPRLPYGVIPVPEYMEKSQTTAYYQPGALDAGRPGYFFANTYDLASRPSWEMEALTLHEAVPGHHLQLALTQELDELPWFRRHGGYTAYTEGWGLYAESLGEEMGFYQDPYSKFGQLTYEMWRAIRLVVDTGIHALGWSREQAIDYFRTNTGKADHDIIVEVDRYIVSPAQALAYKIGELKIKELRAYARGELGERFDVRAFHDQVLGAGALPLSVLEARIVEWVKGQSGEQVATAEGEPKPAGGE